MRDDNVRVREKFELSLDGRQIASIVVGALVILGVVFVLGLNVGRQIGVRHAEAARAGDLAALDRGPTPAPTVDQASLTFHDRLIKERPVARPSVPAVAEVEVAMPPPPPATATGSEPAPPPPTPTAAATASAVPAPSTKTVARAVAPTAVATTTVPSASGAFTIQLGAAQDRADADRLAARFRSFHPRVEPADVPGKGRWYRVRVGSFESREAAERYRRDVARETGAAGFVTASR
jgi:cell division septation protein DedD